MLLIMPFHLIIKIKIRNTQAFKWFVLSLLLCVFCWVEATGVTRMCNPCERKTIIKEAYDGMDHGVRWVWIVCGGRRMKMVTGTLATAINAALGPVPRSEDTPIRTLMPAPCSDLLTGWQCPYLVLKIIIEGYFSVPGFQHGSQCSHSVSPETSRSFWNFNAAQ